MQRLYRCCQKLGKRNQALHALPPAVLRKAFYRNGLMQELFPHVFPGFCCICCHCWTQLEGITDHCSVMNKSCFQLICARTNCSYLSIPHRCRERISNALMAFQSGHVYLYMNCKHLTIACSTSFEALLSVCCVVQFSGTYKCCVGQLLLQ